MPFSRSFEVPAVSIPVFDALPEDQPISPEDLLDLQSEEARRYEAHRIACGERPLLEDVL